MELDQLRRCLDDPAQAGDWLVSCGLENVRRAHANLVALAGMGVTLDLLAALCDQLATHLPAVADPDMALNNVERFFAAARSPLALATLFQRDTEALPILLQLFSTSQHLSDLLITDAEAYDLLRLTEGQPVARQTLVDEVAAELESAPDEPAAMKALRRFKRRETLRICYGDLVRGQRLETVTAQISFLADALIEGALRFARQQLEAKLGVPLKADGSPVQFVVLGLGKLGGNELNYSSDIDLIFLYEADGELSGQRRLTFHEYFDRLARELVRLLTESTPLGQVYRVDLRLRPEGEKGPMISSLEGAAHYYDVLGRTWERQAYVKARAVAGDLALGEELLRRLEPWIFRRYLNLADISGIKALKRRIEQRAQHEGDESRDVKTGHGGIRDIEFVIQFLQLLNGGDLAELRTGNTLEAIARLAYVGCLTHEERTLLEENYVFLRKIEHRLQIMFDLQTHALPTDANELRKLAIRLSFVDKPRGAALTAFEREFQQRTELNRKILDHLLHDAFGDDPATEPEVDLVLDPDPSAEQIREVLGRYPFRDVPQAYRNLLALSTEKIRFLSTRRCRHFLASIAPRLLKAIAETPDPDSTLVNLAQVSDSLGGKGVLWELFSFNPPTLQLYVDLCAYSAFLSGILTSNPGMLDELMDSLVLNKLPKFEDLRQLLTELCRGAEDLEPILHSFKSAQQLRVGVRDMLGKEDVRSTTAALSAIAQTCLEQITLSEYEKLIVKLGEPTLGEGQRAGQPCELVIVALGKFGGAELNYHSDLDLIFLYEGDGMTVPLRRARRAESTTNQHFFSELGQRIIKSAGYLGPYGRLFEVDPRLRPTGRSGALATSFGEFARYFAEGHGQLWERQALCRARVVFGPPEAALAASELIAEAAFAAPWSDHDSAKIYEMRIKLEQSGGPNNLKRGRGGLVDIEFLVQMLQLQHASRLPGVRESNLLAALAALGDAGLISAGDRKTLEAGYRFLRSLEARLRLMDATARDDMPESPADRAKLARMLGYAGIDQLQADFAQHTGAIRATFDRYFRSPVSRAK